MQERWNKPSDLKDSRWDTIISICVGGLITAAVLITAGATIKGMEIQSAADLSLQLEPIMGEWALIFISIGLFAAGLSSALAAPLGAAMTVSSVLKWGNNMKDKRFKIVFVIIISIGITGSALELNPLSVLLFAQALNGILLPVIAITLLVIMNNKKRLGNYTNSLKANIIGGIVALICTGLGTYSLVDAILTFLN